MLILTRFCIPNLTHCHVSPDKSCRITGNHITGYHITIVQLPLTTLTGLFHKKWNAWPSGLLRPLTNGNV